MASSSGLRIVDVPRSPICLASSLSSGSFISSIFWLVATSVAFPWLPPTHCRRALRKRCGKNRYERSTPSQPAVELEFTVQRGGDQRKQGRIVPGRSTLQTSRFPHENDGCAGVVLFQRRQTSQRPHKPSDSAEIVMFPGRQTSQRPHEVRKTAGLVTVEGDVGNTAGLTRNRGSIAETHRSDCGL